MLRRAALKPEQPAMRQGKIFGRIWVCAVALLCLPGFRLAAQDAAVHSPSWSGVIINNSCTADDAFAESPRCTEPTPGTKLSLYDDTIRQVYALDPQAKAIGHLGDSVTVAGALDGATIHVTSLAPLKSFGLDVGQKAPAFSARDQFGQEQTLETLQGAKGTILLFYRSADWVPIAKGS
jgi:AhpC/TSA family